MTEPIEDTQDAADLRLILMAMAERTDTGERVRSVVAARLAYVTQLLARVRELESRCMRCGMGHKVCACIAQLDNARLRISELEAVNAAEPKRVVFEAAHSIVQRIEHLEQSNAAFQRALMLKSEDADKQDRIDATYNAALQGILACERSFGCSLVEMHDKAREHAAHAHGLDVPKPQAQPPEYVPSGLNSVTTEHVLEKRETAKSRAQAFQRTPTAVDAYFAASARLSLAAANIGESWGAGGSEAYHPGSQMHELLAAAEAFAYDSSEALQPRAADEWNTFKSIVAQLALGDLASGPEWLMALRDQARAIVGKGD